MKLYYAPGACSLASHIAAEEEGLGLEMERVDLKAHSTESGADFWRINPKGYVPALKLDDGSLLTENVALLQFLADLKPEKALAPPIQSMERVRLQEWLSYITSELHKAFAPLFGQGPQEQQLEAKKKIEKRLSYIEAQLKARQFLLGAQFTVADAYLFVMLTWCERFKIDLSAFPQLVAYRDRIAARPTVRKAMQAEGLLTPA